MTSTHWYLGSALGAPWKRFTETFRDVQIKGNDHSAGTGHPQFHAARGEVKPRPLGLAVGVPSLGVACLLGLPQDSLRGQLLLPALSSSSS